MIANELRRSLAATIRPIRADEEDVFHSARLGGAQVHDHALAPVRRLFRLSETALVLLSIFLGGIASLLMVAQSRIAHAMQSLIYDIGEGSLSAAPSIDPLRLLALPIVGLLLGIGSGAAIRRWRTPIDVVEANALHGGAIPFRDTLIVCTQTVVSNGAGASVGLEAAYAQAGGGVASVMGHWLRLRRADMRIVVGGAAGAAIAAAFGAPLTGAFYAFEIVIGAYTPAAIAPVAAACITAVLLVRLLGLDPYVVALPGAKAITTADYLLYAGLAVICAVVGIAVIRGVTWVEALVRRSPINDAWRPVIGGMIIMPLAMITPQILSAGHGALHLNLASDVAVRSILLLLVVKIAASAVSLGFGFRGGLFFASLLIGALIGQLFAAAIGQVPGMPTLSSSDAALIGMAAMGAAVIGGPMTMSMLVLEITRDFALASVALTAALCASTVLRETFGFSFSTWRLHMRGETIRSARDVGRVRSLTAGKMMQRGAASALAITLIEDFRRHFPLGSTNKVVLINNAGRYFGIIETARAFDSTVQLGAEIGSLAILQNAALRPSQDVRHVTEMFDLNEADYLAVLDDEGRVLGTLSEQFVHRRYVDEVEKAQRELFGE